MQGLRGSLQALPVGQFWESNRATREACAGKQRLRSEVMTYHHRVLWTQQRSRHFTDAQGQLVEVSHQQATCQTPDPKVGSSNQCPSSLPARVSFCLLSAGQSRNKLPVDQWDPPPFSQIHSWQWGSGVLVSSCSQSWMLQTGVQYCKPVLAWPCQNWLAVSDSPLGIIR